MGDEKRNSTLGLILILGSMAAIGPLSIDMYLPAFNDIALGLNTDKTQVGYTLTSYFIGIGIGQLLFGPLTDRYGRKWPTVIGLGVFLISAFAIYNTPNIEFFIGIRVLMALGGCIGMITSKAIVRDLFPPEDTAKVFSFLMLVMGIAPVIAPTIGGFMVASFGWRSIFLLLTIYSLIIFFSVTFLLKESKGVDPTVSLKPLAVAKDYRTVFLNSWFLRYSMAGSLAYAGMFAYISGASFIYMDVFGLSQQQFGWTFGLNAGGYIGGAQINRLFLKRWSSSLVCKRTMLLQSMVAVIMVISFFIPVLSKGITIAGIWIYLFCLGFITPNTTAQALAPFEKLAGTASALIGGIQMLAGALITGLVSVLLSVNGTIFPIILVMTICSIIGMILLNLGMKSIRRLKKVSTVFHF
ncbi:multidrug effflux MFS transporter [Membranihabitans maritimus]|uniref:multidrug effflux MFS transporter n=1 Tax=Membranihabitans maritimus TaxID=2904244 RepID=UPI001F2FD683|nr:multidrug effflux MFS transporter [Membranihabitans maritimus]